MTRKPQHNKLHKDGLSPKKQQFVVEYLIDRNGTKACIRAGYSPKTARARAEQLLREDAVRKAIQAGMDARAERTGIDADMVLKGIVTTIRRCEQVEPVLDRKGEPVMVETPQGSVAPAYVFDAKNVLRGYELLGKHLKLFTEKVEHTGANGGPIETRVADMSPEQRREEIKRLLKENPELAKATS